MVQQWKAPATMEPLIVGIRFHRVGKIYHFDASICPDLKVGDFAVVETSRGAQLGEVIQLVENPPPPPEGVWKPIQRRASPRDLVMRQIWQKKEIEAMISCRAKAAEMRQEGVKIVAAEYSFDGERLSFLYSTENEGKVELRGLRNTMQRLYPRAKVEMRQIGPRDVAKLLGGMGACGLENRCCSMFLTDFSPVSIKMAKEQGISLTPNEITGMCGRLRCCLVYEYEQYVEARKTLPKRNKRVISPKGEGKVWDVYPLKQTVIVELDTGTRHEFSNLELQPWDELEALRRKALAPCDRHEGGACDCGKKDAAAADEEPEDLLEGEVIHFLPTPVQPAPAAPRQERRERQGSQGRQASGDKAPANQPGGSHRSGNRPPGSRPAGEKAASQAKPASQQGKPGPQHGKTGKAPGGEDAAKPADRKEQGGKRPFKKPKHRKSGPPRGPQGGSQGGSQGSSQGGSQGAPPAGSKSSAS
jgi:cell fate regulator YaaT (PSP1 superfamily)